MNCICIERLEPEHARQARAASLRDDDARAQIQQEVEALAGRLELTCEFRQTNSEATMVDWLQEAFERDAAVIINPAGFSFASVPVLDAVKLDRSAR